MRRFAVTLPALLVVLLLVVLLSFASAATAQSLRKMARIGMLCAPSCKLPPNEAFSDELQKLGWVEGTTIAVERMDPDFHLDQLPALAADLVRSKPDLIAAFTPTAARAAKNATSDIPIVMLFVADPVGMGPASSLAHPGGNLTGVATFVPGGFSAKGLEIVRELLPEAKRVAVFINPANEIHRLLYPKEYPPAAAKLGLQLDLFQLRDPAELPAAVATAKAGGAEALSVWSDPLFDFPPNRLPDLALHAGLPSFSLFPPLRTSGRTVCLWAGHSCLGSPRGALR